MTDNVLKFGKADIDSSRRDNFLRAIAQSFDIYVKKNGCEPDAIVYVLNGLRQPSQIGWQVEGDSKDGATTIIAFAATHVMAEAISGRT